MALNNHCDKFHYVIYTNGQDYFDYMLRDVSVLDNVEVIRNPFEYYGYSRAAKLAHRLHYNGRLNRIVNIPGKCLWNRYYYRENKDKLNSLSKCFIFFITWLKKSNEPYFLYLRRKFPDAKLVLYLEDIVASRNWKKKEFDMVSSCFDLVVTYDGGDAKKYGYQFYPTFISNIVLPQPDSSKHSDVFFCGAAKQRIDVINNLYKHLTALGLECDFNVARCGENDKVTEGINKLDRLMPYSTYLEHLSNTDCLVEILQDVNAGYSLRTWETLRFNKKLITNSKCVKGATFYSSSQFCQFDEVGEINKDFFSINIKRTSDELIKQLSPVFFLSYIQSLLIR